MFRYKNNRLEVFNPKTNKYVKAEYTRADGRVVKSSYYYKLKNQNAIMPFDKYKEQVLTRAKEQTAAQKIKTLLHVICIIIC